MNIIKSDAYFSNSKNPKIKCLFNGGKRNLAQTLAEEDNLSSTIRKSHKIFEQTFLSSSSEDFLKSEVHRLSSVNMVQKILQNKKNKPISLKWKEKNDSTANTSNRNIFSKSNTINLVYINFNLKKTIETRNFDTEKKFENYTERKKVMIVDKISNLKNKFLKRINNQKSTMEKENQINYFSKNYTRIIKQNYLDSK